MADLNLLYLDMDTTFDFPPSPLFGNVLAELVAEPAYGFEFAPEPASEAEILALITEAAYGFETATELASETGIAAQPVLRDEILLHTPPPPGSFQVLRF